MILYRLCGLALVCAAAGMILREGGGGRFAVLLTVGGSLLLSAVWLSRISPAAAAFSTLSERSGAGEWTALLCKALAVGYVTEAGADACRDLGAETVGARLELCGRAELLLLALPCLTRLFETALSLVAES